MPHLVQNRRRTYWLLAAAVLLFFLAAAQFMRPLAWKNSNYLTALLFSALVWPWAKRLVRLKGYDGVFFWSSYWPEDIPIALFSIFCGLFLAHQAAALSCTLTPAQTVQAVILDFDSHNEHCETWTLRLPGGRVAELCDTGLMSHEIGDTVTIELRDSPLADEIYFRP